MEKRWGARDRGRTTLMMGKVLNKGRGSTRGITEMWERLCTDAIVINMCISVTVCGKLALSGQAYKSEQTNELNN